MGRIAEQEGAALAEMFRHPVMDVIGRKPVHFLDANLEVFDCPIADVFEFECIGAVSALIAHGSDQAGFTFPGQRENAQEIGLVEIDVQFAIERGASRFDMPRTAR
jgi:hypothetical protein